MNENVKNIFLLVKYFYYLKILKINFNIKTLTMYVFSLFV